MLPIPQVVIVGRPNVGKSSLFNWIAQRRVAIVDDMVGVTRDRLVRLVHDADRVFELVDTGGIGFRDPDNLTQEIERQIAIAIESANLVLFVVDAHAGLQAMDQEIARRVRKLDKPILCVVNKCDGPTYDSRALEFQQLGFQEVLCVSVKASRNRRELLQAIASYLPEEVASAELPEPVMRLAIVGRRNVGKSTFVNALAQEERMIVSEVPGTTRDSVDVRFEMDGKVFIAIDTPGLRKSKSIRQDVEFYGATRAKESIRRADVVLLFFDANEPISRVDKQLCGYIEEQYKPCVFVVNKWDLYHGQVQQREWLQYLRDEFPSLPHVPVEFTTASTGKNAKRLINHAQNLFRQSRERVSTGALNNLIQHAMERNPPPVLQNRRPKIYYAAQVDVQPPTVILVCNLPHGFNPAYQRYLAGVLRREFPFREVPIRLRFQQRGPSKGLRASDT